MSGLIRRAAVVAGAAVVLLGLAVGVASAAGSAVAATRLAAGAQAVSGGTWGKVKEVPGTAALNTGGLAIVNGVSCASAGNCSAGGIYTDSSGNGQAFVVSQVHGIWGKAAEAPGTATLNTGGFAQILSVSCASAGNCSAGGKYTDSTGFAQAFVVSQVGGKWGKAEEVPGTAALNPGGTALVSGVSCASAGNCTAGGHTLDSAGHYQVFVVSQVNGKWGKAEIVPGIASILQSAIFSVSCASAGNCTAGGNYITGPLSSHTFVVSQVGGKWGKAEIVPGTAGGGAVVSVSCAAAGHCSAGGQYTHSGHLQAFVVSQVGGKWGTAEEVPITARGGAVESVSCASAGNCSAAGEYADSSHHLQAFVVSQVGGKWGKAEEVPGTATLNTGGDAANLSVSCVSAGNCSAGGEYADSTNNHHVFVVSQVGGKWGKAKSLGITTVLSNPDVEQGEGTFSVSCGSAGHCSAGGTYKDSSGNFQAYVVNQT